MKAVFHLNTTDTSTQSEILGNIGNLMESKEVTAEDIALVVNGDAVEVVQKESEASEFLIEYLDKGVSINACSNSLDNRGIDEKELIDGVDSVGSAVEELTRLQSKGYGYIKP